MVENKLIQLARIGSMHFDSISQSLMLLASNPLGD